MDYSAIHEDYLRIRPIRLASIAEVAHISDQDISDFVLLENTLNDGKLTEHWLSQFHKIDVDYTRLLQRVIEGGMRLTEPGMQEKYFLFIEEKGNMGPLVFLGGWNMTLASLDRDCGGFGDVFRFYC